MGDRTSQAEIRLLDQLDQHNALQTERLHGFVGRRLRASRHVQSTLGRAVTTGTIDHTLVCHMGGGAADRYEGRRHTGRADRLRTTTLIPANASYGWEVPDDVDVLHLYIDDDDLRRFALQEFDLDPAKLEMRDHMAADDRFMQNLTPLILDELQSDLPQSQLMLDGFDHIIAGHMLRAYSNAAEILVARHDADLNERDADAVARARQMLLDNLHRNISADELAKAVGLSPFRLMRCFKTEMGVTIHRFLIESRVAFVRDRLRHSQDSLVEISFDAGFANQSHMTSCYTNVMGVSPGKHRRQMRL